MRFNFLIVTALMFTIACRTKQNGSDTLSAGMDLATSGDSLIGLTYADQFGNSLVFVDGKNLAFSGPDGEAGFYSPYKYDSSSNRVAMTFAEWRL